MAKNKTAAELRAENRLLRLNRISTGFTYLAGLAIRWGVVGYIAHEARIAVVVLAGQTTHADIGIKLLANMSISEALAWALAGGGYLYGFKQHKLREDTVKRLSTRTVALEKQIDERRSSSQLTERGGTNPEDEP